MRKISGQLLSSKPVSLSRAAKLITRFAAVDNGSSPTVSLYLQRTADAFNHLVQFHNKRSINTDVENSPDRKRARKLETDKLEEEIPVEKTVRDSKSKGKKERQVVGEVAEANPDENEVKDLKIGRTRDSETDKLEEKNRGKKRKTAVYEAAEANPDENEVKDMKSGAQNLETNKLGEKNADEKMVKDSKNRGKKDRETVNEVAEVNVNELNDLMSEEKEQGKEEKKKKKKKKRKIHGDDSKRIG